MKKIEFLLLTGLCAALTSARAAEENNHSPRATNDTAQDASASQMSTGTRKKVARAIREKNAGERPLVKKLREELKGLSPAEKRSRLQEMRAQKVAELTTKKADGTITGREQKRLDRAEKRHPRFKRAIGPEPKVESKPAAPAS